LEAGLSGWAESRGWTFEAIAADESALERLLTDPGLQLLVTYRSGLAEPLSDLGADVALLAVEEVGMEPAARRSLVRQTDESLAQAAFLAGALAGLASREAGVVVAGGLWDADEALLLTAVEHGIRYQCPNCQFQIRPAEELDPERLRVEGFDMIVVPAAGTQAATLVEDWVQSDAQIVWIGNQIPPEGVQLAGRVDFDPWPVTERALEALLQGEPGEIWVYLVANGSIHYKADPALISPGRRRLLEDTYQALAEDRLDPGVSP
jgi:hypothetical protein